MEESTLINKIQYVFVKKILYNEIERWHIDDVLRVVVCEILPEMGDINIRNSEKSASITDVVKYIEKNDKKEGKNKINFGDEHWITKVKLATKKNWIKNGFKLLGNVDQDGFVALNEKMIDSVRQLGESLEKARMVFHSDGMNFLSSKVGYNYKGEQPLDSHETETNPTQGEDKQKEKQQEEEQQEVVVRNTNGENCEDKLNRLWNEITKGKDGWMPYVWKLKISQGQYERLKQLLMDGYPQSVKRSNFITRHALKLLAYCAEWYKREFNGNDNEDKALDVIQIKYQKRAQLICEKCFEINPIFERFIYGKENTLWLYSIYVLGGLPMAYTGGNIIQLYDKVYELYSGCYEEVDITPENFKFLNSYVVKKSLTEDNGSFRNFITAIIRGERPFAEDDLKIENLQRMVKYLLNGAEHIRLSNKFSLVWNFSYLEGYKYISRSLSIRTNQRQEEYSEHISIFRIKNQWRNLATVIDEVNQFWLGIQFNEGEIVKLVKYENNFRGDFVGQLSDTYIKIPSKYIPQGYINDIKLLLVYNYDNEERGYVVQEEQDLNYIQVYPCQELGNWNNIRNGNCTKSAVVFRDPIRVNGEQLEKYYFGDKTEDAYYFYEFENECNLYNGEEELPLLKVPYKIYAAPKMFKRQIQYCSNNMLEYYEEGQDVQYKKVLWSLNGIDVIVKDGEESKNVDLSDCTIEYKEMDDNRYSRVEDGNTLPSGLKQFRVSYNGLSAKFEAYYVSTIPYRDCQHCRTCFDGLNTGVCLYQNNEIHFENRLSYGDQLTRLYKNMVNVFLIGDNHRYIKVPIYRPFECLYLLFNRDVLRSLANTQEDMVDVFDILKRNYNIKKLTTEGISDGMDIRQEKVNYIEAFSESKPLICKNDELGYRYMLWTESGLEPNQEKREIYIPVSRFYQDDYHFYCWNGLVGDDSRVVELIKCIVDKGIYIKYPNWDNYMVFQSLKDGLNTPRYWKPQIHLNNKFTQCFSVNNWAKEKECFKIAMEHNIYFCMFEPLLRLVTYGGWEENNYFLNFILSYYRDKNGLLSKKEYSEFLRLKNELHWIRTERGIRQEDLGDVNYILNMMYKN